MELNTSDYISSRQRVKYDYNNQQQYLTDHTTCFIVERWIFKRNMSPKRIHTKCKTDSCGQHRL